MPFYKFHQNNSGGSFRIDDAIGIGRIVWIEAPDASRAAALATCVGVYFDGVSNGMDCGCCGDRWSRPYDSEGEQAPDIDPDYDFAYHPIIYVHHLNGRIERIAQALVVK